MSDLYLLGKDTEAAFIGQLMSLGDKYKLFDIIRDRVDHFSYPPYRELYGILYSLYDQGVAVDIASAQEAMMKAGKWKQLSGALLDAVNKARYAPDAYLAYALIDHSVRRQGKQVLTTLLASMDDGSVKTMDAVQDAVVVLDQLLERNLPVTDDGLAGAVSGKIEEIIEIVQEKKKPVKFKGGFADMDAMLGGFKPTELSVIAARTSVGKTAFALNLMLNMAADDIPAYFFSLEMGKQELVARMLSSLTGIDSAKIRDYRLYPQEVSLLQEAAADMKRMPVNLADDAFLTLADIRMRCKRMKRSKGLGVVFVDYLQLIQAPKAYSREREVSMISAGLKAIAKDMDVSVVALSQLNRGVETREDKEPKLADLRESGGIEQDADNVIFLHRPEMYKIEFLDDNAPSKNVCEVIVAKQRNGSTGKIRLSMKKEIYSFTNYMSNKVVNSEGKVINQQDLNFEGR